VTELQPSHSSDASGDGVTLRLLWPQWQGADVSSVREFAAKFPFDVARRGYAVGSAVLAAVLPTNDGPTVAAPVAMNDAGLELRDEIEAKEVIVGQLARALEVIRGHDPARMVTLGGECAVSVGSRRWRAAMATTICELRRARPRWGPRRIGFDAGRAPDARAARRRATRDIRFPEEWRSCPASCGT
jgi:hypothetical protein